MYCGECGTQNEGKSNFCKKCGGRLKNQKLEKPKKKFISLKIISVVFLLLAVGTILVGKMGLINTSDEYMVVKYGDYSQLGEGFTDVKIEDDEDVILAAEEALEMLGIEQKKQDLDVLSVNSFDNLTFYKVQEYIDGYAVYGRTAVVITDEDGTVLGFTSNISTYQDLDLETVPDMELDAVQEYQIYTYNNITTLVYFTPIFDEDSNVSTMEACVDAYTNEVIFINETMDELEAATCYNQDLSISVDGSLDNDEYILYDSERNIIIYSWLGTDSTSEDRESMKITSENNIFGDIQEEQVLNQESGVLLLKNTSLIYDYFQENYSEVPFDNFTFVYDDAFDSGNNASGGYANLENGEKIGLMNTGTNIDLNELDILAHEYTHIVTSAHVGFIDIDVYNEPGAIDEAYSDIFGEIIEAYLTDSEPDWQMSSLRNIADPESEGYPAELTEKFSKDVWTGFLEGTDFSHGYSTIISHCAYQMYTGLNGEYTKLSVEEIADLFYYTMFTIPSNCSFQTLFENLVFVAKLLDYSDEQVQCIEAAFNAAGIDRSNLVYDDESVLSVLDLMRNTVISYEVEVSGQKKTFFGSKDYYNTFTPDENGNVDLILPEGEYELTIMIDDYVYTEKIYVIDNSGYKALTAQTYYFDESLYLNTEEVEDNSSNEVEDNSSNEVEDNSSNEVDDNSGESAGGFDSIEEAIASFLETCNNWEEDDGLYVIFDQDILINEDGSALITVRYQSSEAEIKELEEAGIVGGGSANVACMEFTLEIKDGRYYIPYTVSRYE